ncbi:hypothetical protein FRC01_002534 [Tulasnella sp. 417]|nr:hypothetical protein FRC01_002534 [Tulasnella sp. 417]
MIDELKDLDDLSEKEKAALATISGKLKTVKRKSFSEVNREIVESIGISLPNPAAIGSFDNITRDQILYSQTSMATSTDVGRAVQLLLGIVKQVWVDRTEMASRTIIDLIILAAFGCLLKQKPEDTNYYLSPEHRISEATFIQHNNPSQQLTVGGRVDYLVITADEEELLDVGSQLQKNPEETVLNFRDRCLVTPIEAKSTENMKKISTHFPQVAVEAAAYCATHEGCLTSGRRWLFYLYNADTSTFLTTECLQLSLDDQISIDKVVRFLQYWVKETENPDPLFLLKND